MVSKERIEKLVRAAIPSSATRKFLKLFYEFGCKNVLFPEKPKDLKDEELGKWMRANKTISDERFLGILMQWISNYRTEKMVSVFQPERRSCLPAKTLAKFLLTHHGDCVAESTALGEMASQMGFKIQYFFVKEENLDLSKMSEQEKEILEQQGRDHVYVAIEGVQYDPAMGKIDTHHKGKEETREQRAAEVWVNHGDILGGMGKYKPAIRSHNLALEIRPRYADAWHGKGCIFSLLGMYKEALACYNEAIEIDPRNAKIWRNKGKLFFELELYEEAIKCAKKALSLTPEGHLDRPAMEFLLREIQSELKKSNVNGYSL